MGRSKGVGNGEGAIVTIRRNGKIAGYAPEITVGWKDGKRVRKRGGVERTRGEARAALDGLKRLHANGADMLEKTRKLADYLPYWLEKACTGRAHTRETYQWAIEDIIKPRMGNLHLDQVTTLRLDDFFRSLLEDFAAKSVQLVRTVLNQAFKRAIRWKLILHNPVTDTEPIKADEGIARALTTEQAKAVLAAAEPHRLGLAIRLALTLGLRRGEVCGLRWEDIDLDGGTLTVNGSLGFVQGKGVVYGPPKTAASQRSFFLPGSLLRAIQRHRTHQEIERKAMDWKESPYLFLATKSGDVLSPNSLNFAFRKVLKQAGLQGFRFHDLRHSCASLLNSEGVRIKTISAFLGHSKVSITSDLYIHLFESDLNDAAEVMESRFGAASAPMAPAMADR